MLSGLLPVLLLAATSSAPPLSVAELEASHETFTGRTVEVEGRLAECQPLSCGLLGDGTTDGVLQWLSFDSDDNFDRAATPLIGHRVAVEGVVLESCWPLRRTARSKGKLMVSAPCTDRAPQFKAVRIVRDLGKS